MLEQEAKAWITARLEEDGTLSVNIAAAAPYLDRVAMAAQPIDTSEVLTDADNALRSLLKQYSAAVKEQAKNEALKMHVRALEMKEVK